MVDAAADGFGRLATATIKAKPDVGGPAALPGVQCDLWEGCLTLKDYIFTSESVSEGHPDKVCDQISDAILDAFIANDVKLGHADDSHANTRLGCEWAAVGTAPPKPALLLVVGDLLDQIDDAPSQLGIADARKRLGERQPVRGREKIGDIGR